MRSTAVLLLAGASQAFAAGDQLAADFQAWKNTHKKEYDAKEHLKRLDIYKENARRVQTHNAAFARKETTFALSVDGPFADLAFHEFSKLYLMDKPQNCSATHISSGKVPSVTAGSLPSSVDWRTKGVVTPIKSQGQCGSCWTFSTTGCLEAHHCIKNKKDCSQWTGLAEHQLVDCAQAFNNNGCDGGLPSQAFEYVRYNGGLDLEDSYNYTAKDGKCKFDTKTVGATVKDVFNITSYDEDQIVQAVGSVGPVSIAYQVASDFHLYSHGVYDSYNATTKKPVCGSSPGDVNHAVVVVGYGDTMESSPVPFYIIRNSWGNQWGMEGYFWMIRGKNMCGISDCASYPIV